MTVATTPAIAIVTSQRRGEVALMDQDGRLRSEAVRTAASGDDLLPALERLGSAGGVRPSDLRTVVVDVGPGGFTGLRVGISAAKFIAEVAGAALVPVPSAQVVVAGLDVPATVHRLLVVLAVKQHAEGGQSSTHAGTAWCTAFHRAEGEWREAPGEMAQGCLRTLDWIVEGYLPTAGAEHALVAEAAFLPAASRAALGRGVAWLEPRWSAAAALARGLSLLAEGAACDPAALAPIYPRPPEAAVLWERRLADNASKRG